MFVLTKIMLLGARRLQEDAEVHPADEGSRLWIYLNTVYGE